MYSIRSIDQYSSKVKGDCLEELLFFQIKIKIFIK